MYKKHIIAAAILATVAGAAQSATSVTLYGRMDVGYENSTGNFTSGNRGFAQTSAGESRLGIKGTEDLGKGWIATFQLEGRFDGDTGTKTVNRALFDRESTIGFKYTASNGFSTHVRLGRSISALEQAMGFFDLGRRSSSADTYRSATRHSNALFVNHAYGAFSFGGDVTSKGGYNDGLAKLNVEGATNNMVLENDGVSGESLGYGLFAKYKAHGLEMGAAYQVDNAHKLINPTRKAAGNSVNSEWGVAAAYTYKMLTAGLSYSQGKGDGLKLTNDYETHMLGAFFSANVTSVDTINLVYRQTKDENENKVTGTHDSYVKTSRYALGYIHALSKRTSVYADFAHIYAHDLKSSYHKNTWDVAIRHTF